ncbi:hypothetical protein [Streptomyces sp. KL2]|uniref:hypothetical protein n=1 Tax=Streptomyces sp. KL2 TaxID=3050126 RepID=UPI0039790E69
MAVVLDGRRPWTPSGTARFRALCRAPPGMEAPDGHRAEIIGGTSSRAGRRGRRWAGRAVNAGR